MTMRPVILTIMSTLLMTSAARSQLETGHLDTGQETGPLESGQLDAGPIQSGVAPGERGSFPSDRQPGRTPAGIDETGPISAGPPRVARIREGNGTLPTDAGQVWREYDLRPYVDRMQGIPDPQQTIVDWVLRETGTGVWFGQPFGVLNADSQTLRVYHSPEQQAIVTEVVERFVRPDHQSMGVGVHLVTVGSPSWRTQALKLMRPVPVQTPGLDAWLLTREQASVLASQLRARVDFREHNSNSVTVLNGQSHTLSRWVPRTFSDSILPTPTASPGYQIQRGEIKEGFSLTVSPLVTLDGASMEAVIQCQVDQVEKLSSISVELPPPAQGRAAIDIPQVASWKIHERFRWPMDEVLLISRGVVAMPGLERADFSNLPAVITSSGRPPRADALLFLVCRSVNDQRTPADQQGQRAARLNYHGRY